MLHPQMALEYGPPSGSISRRCPPMTTVTSEPTPAVSAVSPELEAFIEGERRRADVTGTAVAAFDRDGKRFAEGLVSPTLNEVSGPLRRPCFVQRQSQSFSQRPSCYRRWRAGVSRWTRR